MFAIEVQTAVRSAPKLPSSTRLGPVRIAVTDRASALQIWHDVVGLSVVSDSGSVLQLGVGAEALIELEIGATRRAEPRAIGLYHVAIHVPSRTDLAQFAVRALQRGVRIAPTDHLVSEAIYLWDNDGNGIEITLETPWRGRLGDPERGAYAVTIDGKPHSGREPIDLDGLLAELEENPVLQPMMPAGTRVGHVHVHVNSLEDAMRFYRDGLGFAGLFIIRSFGMGDVGLDYPPHAIAFNIWAGANAALPPPGTAGLRWFTIRLPDAAALDGVKERLAAIGVTASGIDGGIEVVDPSGNVVRLVVN